MRLIVLVSLNQISTLFSFKKYRCFCSILCPSFNWCCPTPFF